MDSIDRSVVVTYSALLKPDGTCPYCGRTGCAGAHRSFKGDTLFAEIRAAELAGDRDTVVELQRVVRELEGDGPATRRRMLTPPRVPAAPTAGLSSRRLRFAPRAEPDDLVTLRSSAFARIETEVHEGTSRDGLETGGLLYADRRGDAMEIVAASGMGVDIERTATSGSLDTDYAEQLERDLYSPDLVRVGIWHTHPSGGAVPSDPDLEGLAAMFLNVEERLGARAAAVGIVVAGRYADVDALHAYVVRRDPISRDLVCENAQLKERDYP